jgi:SpoIVB peptidase S55
MASHLRPHLIPWIRAAFALASASIAVLISGPARAVGGTQVDFQGGFPITNKAKIYRLSEVKRGDKGIGYTVITGDQIVSFNVEILGLMESMLGPHRDVILSRLTGPEIEFTGVIAGMSGSPVYIDGRLVGAISYRFGAFSKEAIAGITPIESMLAIATSSEIMTAEREDQGSVFSPIVISKSRGIRVSDLRSRDLLPAPAIPRMTPVVGPYDPQPIETPIMLGGFDPSILEELRARMKDAGFVTIAAGAGGRSSTKERIDRARRRLESNKSSVIAGGAKAAPIAPGAPLAAVLMRGDMNVAATGTVTFVDGDEVFAFGHPFLGYGHVAYPLATASILNTLASPLGSFKMGAPALEVGAITHDRLTAIAGKLGLVAPMVPAHVRVQNLLETRGKDPARSDANVEIVKDPVWLPTMLETAIASTAQGRLGFEAGGTVDLELRIEVGDRTLEIKDSYSAEPPLRVSAFVARDVANIVGVIARQSIVPAEVKSVHAELRVTPVVNLSVLEQVVPDRSIVHPGERLALTARVRPYKRDPVFMRIEAEVPNDARGDLEVFVGGGIELDLRDGNVYGDRYPTSLDDLLAILGERRPSRGLYARVFMQRPGLRKDAELLSSLPPSAREMLSVLGGRTSRSVSEAMGPTTAVEYKDVVLGGVAVPVTVVR